jgi:di/tripeptidase
MRRWVTMWLTLLATLCLFAASPPSLINRERLTDLFVQLAQIDSGSENEAEIAQFLARRLEEMGAEFVAIDDASKKLGGTGGNVFARFRGTVNAPPVLLSAHMDTVAPTKNLRLVRTNEQIATDGTTILGADDKAGIAPHLGSRPNFARTPIAPSAIGNRLHRPRRKKVCWGRKCLTRRN